jgi:hypothetical protein
MCRDIAVEFRVWHKKLFVPNDSKRKGPNTPSWSGWRSKDLHIPALGVKAVLRHEPANRHNEPAASQESGFKGIKFAALDADAGGGELGRKFMKPSRPLSRLGEVGSTIFW